MKVIYLIGGICNGKTAFAKMFEKLGATFIDLDELSKEVLKDEKVISTLKHLRIPNFIDGDKINSDALSEYLFSSRTATQKFDEMFFPYVKDSLDSKLSSIGKNSIVLVEYSGYYGQSKQDDIFLNNADFVVWIESSLKDKLLRGEKRGIKPFELTWRMRVQPFDEEYEAVADYIIHNNSTKEALGEHAKNIWSSCCE